MKRPLIAVDIDDVLSANAKGFIEFSNQRWGTNLTVDDYIEDWSTMWQVEHDETERRAVEFTTSGYIRQYDHDDAALPVLRKLKEEYDLIVVTSRRLQMKGDTLAWVQTHYPGIFEENTIYFAGIWDTITDEAIHKTKGDILRDLGADYLIDDQPKHCIGALQHGIQPVLFGEYSWNRGDDLPDGVVRVKDWAGILEYFHEQSAIRV